MTSRIAVIAINARQPSRIARFWAEALGWQTWPDAESGIVSLAPPGATDPSGISAPSIDVVPVLDDKTVINRLHLDLRADGSSQDEEVERLLALGATRADVGQSDDATWVVLADPEGNEFCVLQRSVQEARGPVAGSS